MYEIQHCKNVVNVKIMLYIVYCTCQMDYDSCITDERRIYLTALSDRIAGYILSDREELYLTPLSSGEGI